METELDVSREEGELSDDSDHYTPLQRPPTYSATAVPTNRFAKIIESESEEEVQQSSSDSDSDLDMKRQKPKKAKFKIKPKAALAVNPRHKKYDIWSTRMQEDVLSETLNSCDVSLKDRSRDVESYDYTLSRNYRFNNEGEKEENKFKDTRCNNKRTRGDRKNMHLRLKKKNSDEDENKKGAPRALLDLAVDVNDSLEDIVKDIANKLFEEKEELIRTILTVAGKDKAFKLYKEVQKIESEGGMLIMNQTRRRTPGGVYFFLIKHDADLTRDQHREIFGDHAEKFKQDLKEKKKRRRQEMKAKIVASRNKNKDLPELLTRAELCVQQLVSISDRTRKDTDHEDVINPPPTPETDCHENDNSGDGMDHFNGVKINASGPHIDESVLSVNEAVSNINASAASINQPAINRKIESYEDDYLDMTAGTDMDLF